MTNSEENLQERVLTVIGRGVSQPMADEEFNECALALFAGQFAGCAAYRAYCEQQNRTPPSVRHWKEIPAAPTRAFQNAALASFPVDQAAAVFHTSGTTLGKPGKHYLRTTAVYEAAIIPNFAAHLFPEPAPAATSPAPGSFPARPAAKTPLLMLVLTPAPEDAPHSSLAHMMGVVVRQWGATGSKFYVRDGSLQIEELIRDLNEAQRLVQPVFLLGTAFAFVHLLDHCLPRRWKFELAKGSRLMETGGFKGRSRQLPKRDLYDALARLLHLPPTHLVNEYGMTELSTQFYDESMRAGRPSDLKTVPPWARVSVIDPHTGQEAAAGQPGLIRIWDLANLWSMVCIQTEDLGIRHPQGFELLGRASDAESRGCSLEAEFLPVR